MGLDRFMKNMSRHKHLWYSKEFQTFLRGNGDIEKVVLYIFSYSSQSPANQVEI